jgi:hypothetical protein
VVLVISTNANRESATATTPSLQMAKTKIEASALGWNDASISKR